MNRVKGAESHEPSQSRKVKGAESGLAHGYGKMAENRKITAEVAAVVGDKEENESLVLKTKQLRISMTDTVRARTGVLRNVSLFLFASDVTRGFL